MMERPTCPGYDLGRLADALAEIRSHRISDTPCGPSPLLGDTVVALGRTGSTQEDARALVRAGAPHGTIVIAEEQTRGRGRRGRSWVSPPGTGLWATVILRRPLPEAAPQVLTLAAAVAVCEGARALGAAVEIKWPNDIIASGGRSAGGKVAGVLGEVLASDAGPCALLGIGVNDDWTAGRQAQVQFDPGWGAARPRPSTTSTTGATDEAREALARTAFGAVPIDQPVADLRACGISESRIREDVLASLTAHLEGAVFAAAGGGLPAILARWQGLSPSSEGSRGSVVPVAADETPGEPVRGTTRGLAADGSLLVEDDAGVVHLVRFGGTLRLDRAEERECS